MAGGFGFGGFLYFARRPGNSDGFQISQVLAKNLRPSQNFLFAHSNDSRIRFSSTGKVSAVALGTIMVTGMPPFFVARQRRNLLEPWWALVTLAFSILISNVSAEHFSFGHLPKLQFVQFPWRCLLPLDVALCVLRGRGFAKLAETVARLFAILIATAAIGTTFVKDAWWDSEDIPVLADGIRSGMATRARTNINRGAATVMNCLDSHLPQRTVLIRRFRISVTPRKPQRPRLRRLIPNREP